MDALLEKNLEYFRNSTLNDDWDCLFIVDGREGSGKSTVAGQVGVYLDKDHHIDLDTQVAFTPDQFIEKALKLEKGKVIIFDEGRTGLNRRRSLSKENFKLTNFLAECRQRNLFIVIVLPYFHDLDSYIVTSRAMFLIHARIKLDLNKKILTRGFYDFYSFDRMKKMFCDERYRRFRSYMKDANFSGTFGGSYAWNTAQYKLMKAQALEKYNLQEDKAAEPPGMTMADVLDINGGAF